ncbi:hypothetical protein F5I97DRAFT_1832184 [Phlebopus sp. FC_14]|nr:hypothetical protein F5I97DRAFT_1832184 [Phlebopus sp. FC_14]
MSPKVVSAATQMLALSKVRSAQATRHQHRPLESLKAGVSRWRKASGTDSSTPSRPMELQAVSSMEEKDKNKSSIMRCSGCNDYGDLVFCQENGCQLAFCVDRTLDEGIKVKGCLSLEEIKALPNDQSLICPVCSIKKRIPFHLSYQRKQTRLVHLERIEEILWISLALKGVMNTVLRQQLKASLNGIYGRHLWEQLVWMNEIDLEKAGPHKSHQKCPEVADLPVLITVETHSMIESGEVMCGTRSGSEMLSEVMAYYLTEKVQHYIRSSQSPVKGLIALFCGPTMEIDGSRKDLEELMTRFKLRFILGFSAESVNPPMVADTLNSFCISLYCKGMSIMGAFLEVFGGKRDFLTKYPVVLMLYDDVTEMMAYGALSHNPWGVPKPNCPKCQTNLNVQAKRRKKGKGVKITRSQKVPTKSPGEKRE